MTGSQDYPEDPRNKNILVYINGSLVPRDQAFVSVFDSGLILGDGVQESFRVRVGRISFLNRHLDRLRRTTQGVPLQSGGL